jgi:hypothetical protein
VPDLPWFVYAMLLAPLGLILVAAVYKTLQARAAHDWPSTPGKVVTSNSELREVKVLDASRENGHRYESRNFANIAYEYSVSGQTFSNNASASARTAVISRSPKSSRVIRLAPSSRSTTTRCIRARRCWSATCRTVCGAASGSQPRSRW